MFTFPWVCKPNKMSIWDILFIIQSQVYKQNQKKRLTDSSVCDPLGKWFYLTLQCFKLWSLVFFFFFLWKENLHKLGWRSEKACKKLMGQCGMGWRKGKKKAPNSRRLTTKKWKWMMRKEWEIKVHKQWEGRDREQKGQARKIKKTEKHITRRHINTE